MWHIQISGYNSQANGIVKRSHFDIRQALVKACKGDISKWNKGVYLVFWAERMMTRKRMGCSPFYTATGAIPLIPLDIVEATYLQPTPTTMLTTMELIARQVIALQKRPSDLEALHSKVHSARIVAAIHFEKKHFQTIENYTFEQGDLVLVHDTKIEKSLDKKMKLRYLGPLIMVSRTQRGAYIVCTLDGAVLHNPIVQFCVIPYLARKSIFLPEGFTDIGKTRLDEMEEQDVVEGEENCRI